MPFKIPAGLRSITVAYGFVVMVCAVLAYSNHVRAAEGPQEVLLKEVKTWAGKQLGIEAALVDVPPLDARLKIPHCPEPLQFDFPFQTRDTVRALCHSSKEQVFVRITATERKNVLLASRDLKQGQVIAESDTVFGKPARWTPELVVDRTRLVGKTLLQPVAQGEPFRDLALEQRVQALRVTKVVKTDDIIPADALKPERIAADVLPRGAMPARQPSLAARAARELIPGQILLSDDVKEVKTVAIARTPLNVGQTLEADSFELRKIPLSGDEAEFVTDLREIENLESTRSLAPGTALRRQDTKPAVIVHRGQQITVQFAASGGLEVTFIAEALNDARLGEMVSVKNQDSGKIVQAVVSGKGTARAR